MRINNTLLTIKQNLCKKFVCQKSSNMFKVIFWGAFQLFCHLPLYESLLNLFYSVLKLEKGEY